MKAMKAKKRNEGIRTYVLYSVLLCIHTYTIHPHIPSTYCRAERTVDFGKPSGLGSSGPRLK